MNILQNSIESKMRQLVDKLNEASDAYYNEQEIMTNFEYDKLLEELTKLEKSSGIVLSDSPNRHVGSAIKIDKISKWKHMFPALSLDKTKDVNEFIDKFNIFGDSRDKVLLMWKLDGCTVQLTYEHGHLVNAATRGDGYIGQDITHNAQSIIGIPLDTIDSSNFTVRGEAVISYKDFEEINSKLPDDKKFKNPRNLASATISMLDPTIVKQRKVHFKMFELVDHPLMSEMSFYDRIVKFAETNRFDHVESKICDIHDIDDAPYIKDVLDENIFDPNKYEFPVDGLVGAYLYTQYSDSLEGTEHHPNPLKGYALKWADQEKETTIRNIEWSPSRTGSLNPVAVFDPVEIDGTTVQRASLHNVSIMEQLHIHIGDHVSVIRANMVIPQITQNLSNSDQYYEDTKELNVICPSCGSTGVIRKSPSGIKMMYCPNPSCKAKLIDKLVNFCSRDAMDIEGLSEKTLQTFEDLGYISNFEDIFTLDKYKDKIIKLPRFGEASWNNIWSGIQKSAKSATFSKFVVGLGIPGIGIKQSKSLSKEFHGDIHKFLDRDNRNYDYTKIDGFGQTLSDNIYEWMTSNEWVHALNTASYLTFLNDENGINYILSGKTFVITGKLDHYKNRKELEAIIEKNDGKVNSSVTSKTSYLINNDVNSMSSKNKKAKQLNIPIITEQQFEELLV